MNHEVESTLREPVRRAYEVCLVEVSVAVLSWKMTIVKNLLDAPMRYGGSCGSRSRSPSWERR